MAAEGLGVATGAFGGAGEGGPVAGAAGGVAASKGDLAGEIFPRTTMSTRRFCARPAGEALSATGWYSAWPAADSRSGVNPYFTINKRTNSVARAVDSSQLSLNCALWIGLLDRKSVV